MSVMLQKQVLCKALVHAGVDGQSIINQSLKVLDIFINQTVLIFRLDTFSCCSAETPFINLLNEALLLR